MNRLIQTFRRAAWVAAICAAALLFSDVAGAQAWPDTSAPTESFSAGPEGADVPTLGTAIAAAAANSMDPGEDDPASIAGVDGKMSTAVEIALLLTALSLLPAVLITLTSFTRIVIVLSFVRRALSLNELPPNQILIGLALFLTMFVMAPVGDEIYTEAWGPYDRGEIELEEASGRAWTTMATFLVANTRENELRLFADLSGSQESFAFLDDQAGDVFAAEPGGSPVITPGIVAADLPLTVVIPAFILSELKTAFQMGFLLFLPFLVIDLVVSSILLSMGMFMLPPVMISTPIKVLVFVLVDGWRLVTESVVTSFVQTVGV